MEWDEFTKSRRWIEQQKADRILNDPSLDSEYPLLKGDRDYYEKWFDLPIEDKELLEAYLEISSDRLEAITNYYIIKHHEKNNKISRDRYKKKEYFPITKQTYLSIKENLLKEKNGELDEYEMENFQYNPHLCKTSILASSVYGLLFLIGTYCLYLPPTLFWTIVGWGIVGVGSIGLLVYGVIIAAHMVVLSLWGVRLLHTVLSDVVHLL